MEDKKLHKLIPALYPLVLPLFDGFIRDPLMHAVIEGRRPGHIYTDNPENPQNVVIWTETECVYVAGNPDDASFNLAFRKLIEEKLIPVSKKLDMDFLSIFSYPNGYPEILERELSDLEPLRTPANTFAFNRKLYRTARESLLKPPMGMRLRRIDEHILFDADNENLLDGVLHYWHTAQAFLQNSIGYAMLDNNRLVSWLYVQAFGAGGQAPDIWTDPEYRGMGLASILGARWVEDCLMRGQIPFWINDEANRNSRRLAENIGFEYRGNIELVDIPFYPFEFYKGMARHFFLINDSYRSAAMAFERAFALGNADPSDYFLAAASWMHADEPEKAMKNLWSAVDHGLEDLLALEGAEAFSELRELPEWEDLKHYYLSTRRNN